jgi:hypothetical protein
MSHLVDWQTVPQGVQYGPQRMIGPMAVVPAQIPHYLIEPDVRGLESRLETLHFGTAHAPLLVRRTI